MIDVGILIIAIAIPGLLILAYRLGRIEGYDEGYTDAMVEAIRTVDEVIEERRKKGADAKL